MLLRRLTLIATLAVVALPTIAEPPTTAQKEMARAAEVAVFEVPGLKDEAVVKGITAALAKVPGVSVAKPDAVAGTFAVTFEASKTTIEALTSAVTTVAPGAKLGKVSPASPTAAKRDCGACPSKSSCAKETK